MAEKLDVGKSDIMDFGAENLAVRVALAETHVIGDAKDYLKSVCVKLLTTI
jgi:multiple RNA-binding domain-containing protein 1